MNMEVYKVSFNQDTTGVFGISLVAEPAVEENFIALAKQEEATVKMATVSEEKRIVMGAVLIPDKPILRIDGERQFYIVFPQETIELASQRFFQNGFQSNSTLEHDPSKPIDGVTVVESWIKTDATADKSVAYGLDYPVGTWVAMMKIENDTIWNEYVKSGEVKGFSIDGAFPLELINKPEISMNLSIDAVVQAIKDGFASVKLSAEQPQQPEEQPVALGAIKTADGLITINYEGDTLAVDVAVTALDADGNQVPLADGEYTLENGQNITVTGGKVAEISTTAEETADVTSGEETATMMAKAMSEFAVEMAKAFGQKIEELRVELKKDIEAAKAETIVSMTANNPEKTRSFEEMTPFERHMATRKHIG